MILSILQFTHPLVFHHQKTKIVTTNVEGAKTDEEATYEEDQGNETVEDTKTDLDGRDEVMTDVLFSQVQATQETEDTHVTLTPVNPDGQQQSSSVSSGFVSNMLNPNQDTGVDDIFGQHTEATSLIDTPVTAIMEPSFTAQINRPPTPYPHVIQTQQPPIMTPATTTSSLLQNLPNFASLFGFDYRLKALEDNFSELRQTNQYAEALSSIPGTVDQYLANKMQEAVDVAVQLKYDRIRVKSTSEINNSLTQSMKEEGKIIKGTSQKRSSSKLLLKIRELVNDQLESEVWCDHQKKPNKSDIQRQLYKTLVDAYEADKILLDTYGDTVTIKRPRDGADDDQEPSAGTDRGSKRRRGKLCKTQMSLKHLYTRSSETGVRDEQEKKRESTKQNRKLDWINLEGRNYPHDLTKTTTVDPNSQGVGYTFSYHFINNDLEYLRGVCQAESTSTSVHETRLQIRAYQMDRKNLVEWMTISILMDYYTKGCDVFTNSEEGDFPQIRIQDIKAMLLLLVLSSEASWKSSIGALKAIRRNSTSQADHNKDKKKQMMRIDELHKYQRCYKAVRLRFSDPMIQPEPEGSTQGYPLVSVEVLRSIKPRIRRLFTNGGGGPGSSCLTDHNPCSYSD
ncbi:hypothetical protein Tco_1244597 [Tanacetum coccineum]